MKVVRSSVLFLVVVFVLLARVSHAEDAWSESYRLEALAKYKDAARVMDKLIKAEPKNDFAISRRAWLNYLRGAYNKAVEDYRKAIRLNPKSLDARLGLLLPLLAQQRWREASSSAKGILKEAPLNYYAHVRLMSSEAGERKWRTLADHAARVAAYYPSDATVQIYLARANARLKNTRAAREAYKRVLERIPGHAEATRFLKAR